MEKRILLAFVLSFAVLYAFRALYVPTPVDPAGESSVAAPTAGAPGPATTSTQDPDTPRITMELAPPEPGSVLRAEKADKVVFDTTLYSAEVSNVGGVLKSFKLKAYTDMQGQPIELIDADGATKLGWPLSLVSGDAAVDEALGKALYVVLRDENRIDLEFAEGGLHARKRLTFNPLNYEFSIESSVQKDGKPLSHSIVWQGGFGDQSVPHDPVKKSLVYHAEGQFERLALGSIEEQELTTHRAGAMDQYFMAMFLLDSPGPFKVKQNDYAIGQDETVSTIQVMTPKAETPSVRIYAGPKAETWLRRADPELPAVIDYGMFEFIAQPLMLALLWINGHVGNFGWAIVILTVFINFVLFPLRLKSQISMQKMQKIQPQMKSLQDKYKKLKTTDPKRAQVQQEMMGLYKQHGVNPMGGCLPLLLQMPFFFAFWSMLSEAIELRQAPWMLWIKDLSQHDPYYIIPILMALTMIIMQKMTPSTMDPAQAKMMMIMPLMLTFMFFWVQAGLTLYWLTGNVVGIGQQFFINKFWSTDGDRKSKAKLKAPPDK